MTIATPVSVVPTQAAPVAPVAPAAPAPQTEAPKQGFEDLDSFVAEKAAPKPEAKQPEKKAEPDASTKPAEPNQDDGLELEEELPDTTPAPVAEKPKEEPKKAESFRTPKELREAYGREVKEKFSLLGANATLKAKIEALEKGGTDTAKVEAVTKELEAVRARNAELEGSIKGYDYTQSAEYKTKFLEPLNTGIKAAQKTVGQLEVEVPGGLDDEGNQKPSTMRPATWDDFLALYELPPARMDRKAVEMFGPSARRVTDHIDQLRNLKGVADEAAANSSKLAEERRQTEIVQTTAQYQKAAQAYESKIKELTTKYPKIFGEIEGDAEASAARGKGLMFADRAMSNQASTPEERAALHAELRMRAGVVPLLLHQKKQLSQKLAEAEAKLKAYESSGPKRDASGEQAAATGPVDIEAGIDQLPKRSF